MNKIKVCFVINDFTVGGAQRLLADTLRYIDHTRFECRLITLFELRERADMFDILPPGTQLSRLAFRGRSDLKAWFSLIKLLRKERPAVVVSSLFFSNTVMRLLKPFFGYRVITCEHNTYVFKTALERFTDRLLAAFTYTIVAVSPSVKTFTAQQEGIALSKFRVIENGIDLETIAHSVARYDKQQEKQKLGFGDEKKLILTVGRLTTQKNHRLLIDGFKEFAEHHPEYELLIVGGGALKQSLEQQAARLGIASRVHFMGSQSEVFLYYAISDFFVSTSTIEGFGLAHAEALACGLPLLSTKTAGPDQMIEEGRNGFFIRDKTPGGVALSLEKMVQAEPETMRAYAQVSVKRYDIKETVRKYEQLIQNAAQA